MKRIILFVTVFLSFAAAAQDSTYARRIIRDLTSPEMFGRGMQHRGDSIAANYLRNELKANPELVPEYHHTPAHREGGLPLAERLRIYPRRD